MAAAAGAGAARAPVRERLQGSSDGCRRARTSTRTERGLRGRDAQRRVEIAPSSTRDRGRANSTSRYRSPREPPPKPNPARRGGSVAGAYAFWDRHLECLLVQRHLAGSVHRLCRVIARVALWNTLQHTTPGVMVLPAPRAGLLGSGGCEPCCAVRAPNRASKKAPASPHRRTRRTRHAPVAAVPAGRLERLAASHAGRRRRRRACSPCREHLELLRRVPHARRGFRASLMSGWCLRARWRA